MVRIEPSRTTRDAPCPHCGVLLWFNGSGAAAVIKSASAVPESLNIDTLPLNDLELSVRLTNVLEVEGITTVANLCEHTSDDLLVLRSFNEDLLAEVRTKLAAIGVGLRGEQ
jgi:DNA-directed RNA polymerase alpha subunit